MPKCFYLIAALAVSIACCASARAGYLDEDPDELFAAVYVPAFQAKDLALALDEHKKELSPEQLKIAEPAITRLVRSAYLLDAFGDIGNKQQIAEAYSKFVEAANDIQSAFPHQP